MREVVVFIRLDLEEVAIPGDEFILLFIGVFVDEGDECLLAFGMEIGEVEDVCSLHGECDGKVRGSDEHEMYILGIIGCDAVAIDGRVWYPLAGLVHIFVELPDKDLIGHPE